MSNARGSLETIPVLVLGAGGHGRVVLDALLASRTEVMGILERDERLHGHSIMGVPVLGGDSWADRLEPDAVLVAVGVAGFGESVPRPQLVATWSALGYAFARIAHPSAVISPFATVADGAQVLARAVVNPGSRLAAHVIVNTASVVEHDCELEEGAHLAPGVVLGGAASIGAWAQVGMNATVLPGRRVGEAAIVGAGALVTRDVAPGALVIGVPARSR